MTRLGAAGLMMSPAPMIKANPPRPRGLAAAIAAPIPQARAAPAQRGRPVLGHIRPDDSENRTAKKGPRTQQNEEQPPTADKDVVEIARGRRQQRFTLSSDR